MQKVSSTEKKKFEEGKIFQIRPIDEVRLENGLSILFIKDHRLPRISLSLMVKVGRRHETLQNVGLNSFTADLLETGTRTRSALQVTDDFAALGAGLSASGGDDASFVVSSTLTESADEVLNLFHEVITAPAFSEKEIARLKSETRAALKKRWENPSTVASDFLYSALYKNHPFGAVKEDYLKSYNQFKKSTVIKHYLNWYRPNNSTLAVVGNFDEAFAEKVKEKFKSWPMKTITQKDPEGFEKIPQQKIKIISKKNIQQAQIRFAEFGIRRNNEDFLKLRIANEIFGAGFSSRLNQKIRDDLGLTYSISSGMDASYDQGSFSISTFTKNETAEKTVDEVLKVFKNFVDNGVTDEELKAAKNQLLGQFPRSLETGESLAQTLMIFDYYGVSRNYLSKFKENVESISKQDILDVVKKYMDPEKMIIVIYGDEKSMGEQFKTKTVERIKIQP